MPRHALRSAVDLTRSLVEMDPLDMASVSVLVDRIGSLAGPLVERPAREAAQALRLARARPRTRHGVLACCAVMDLITAAETVFEPRLH